ncbi:hypothetical protein [Citrobacter freundii]|uniref:hypothetical protein n=1 Tax=Citrobacter freundii TaxID=546 RepID=UPI0007386ECF|nr:hypothetical protein [Citrobacter freundii]EJD6418607.1 hypothetical protein [Citrobacter freundii]EJD6622174.1 hypothetical protein [Citrobacter freundii]EKV1387008.1 hypothetical protein [Citrobacter freundii]MBJ9191882.1 hypothetical protein [Citrobacter freundii]MBM7197376.1 hypothetical protein [Citrobacter freundii]
MTTKAAKAAAAAAAAGDVKKPDELTPENTVDGNDGQNTAAGSGDTGVDLTGSETNGATGLTGAEVARKAVFFLGPYHRYSRGDTACFDAEYAEKLVERHIAVWPEDAEKALSPRKGADDHDTDIG